MPVIKTNFRKGLEPGSTPHCWHFVQLIRVCLETLAGHGSRRNFSNQSPFQKAWSEYKAKTKANPGQFRVVMFKFLEQAVKNQHCVIIVSDYYANFFLALKSMFELAEKELSEVFLRDFLRLPPLVMQEYAENFHVHFIPATETSMSLKDWAEWANNRHGHSKDFSKIFNFFLAEIDDDDQSQPGWKPVDPRQLYVDEVLVPARN